MRGEGLRYLYPTDARHPFPQCAHDHIGTSNAGMKCTQDTVATQRIQRYRGIANREPARAPDMPGS
jgi:hypothetical protein